MTREEAKKILACRGNGYSEEDFNNAIEVAFNCIPSLPSNLDEAASAWTHNHPYSYPTEIFKGGAECMAGQGVTVECGVRVYPTLDGESHPWVSLYKNGINVDSLKDIPGLELLGFEDGDKAIVQIRKK